MAPAQDDTPTLGATVDAAASSSPMLRTLAFDTDARTQVLHFLPTRGQAPLIASCRTWHRWMSYLAPHSAAVMRGLTYSFCANGTSIVTMAASKWARAIVEDVTLRFGNATTAGEVSSCFASLSQLTQLRRLRIENLNGAYVTASAFEAMCCARAERLEELAIDLLGDDLCQWTALVIIMRGIGNLRALRAIAITLMLTEQNALMNDETHASLRQQLDQSFGVLPTLPALRQFVFQPSGANFAPSLTQARALAQCARLKDLVCHFWTKCTDFGGFAYTVRDPQGNTLEILTILADSPAGQSLTHLSLNPVWEMTAPIWTVMQRFPRLTTLTGEKWSLTGDAWRQIGVFTHLRSFHAGVFIDAIGSLVDGLIHCTALEELTITSQYLPSAMLETLLCALVRLTRLELNRVELDSLDAFTSASSTLRRLILRRCGLHVHVPGRQIPPRSLRILETLPAMPQLRELVLHECHGHTAPTLIRVYRTTEQEMMAREMLRERFPQLMNEPQGLLYLIAWSS